MSVSQKRSAGWIQLLGTVSCTGVIALSAASPVMAADSDAASADAAPVLEEVTVHAQRRQESLERVPITVDTISGADAMDRGSTSIQTLAATIPNLTFTTASYATNTYIRGVGDNSASVNNEPSVATYIDGVYNPVAIALTSFNFNNIEQIEVLKGPQGTLFGRNSTAGVIQILTPDPKQEFSGKVEGGYGNYNTINADTYITGGLTPKLAGDLALLYQNQMDGFGHTSLGTPTFRQRDIAARSKWLYDASDITKVRFTAEYSKFVSDGTSDEFVPGSFGPYVGPWNTNSTPTLNDTQEWSGALRVDQEINDAIHGVSITSYRQVKGNLVTDSDFTPAYLNEILQSYEGHYVTQEFQLSNSNPGRLTWLAGAFFYGNQIFGSDPRVQYGTKVKGGYTAAYGVQDTASGSLFGHGTLEVVDGTKLTLGVRYTDEELKASSRTDNRAGAVTAGPYNQSIISRPVTWRIALDHQITEDVLGYVSFNRGFKSGGYNLSSPGSAPFFPEHVDAYETGIKSEFLDHRLRLNTAFFYYRYTDLQVAVVLGGNQLFENAAAARNYGLDSSLDFAATDHLTLSAGLGLLSAKYTNYPGANGYTPFGVAYIIPNAKGQELPYAPPVTGSVSANYRQPTPVGAFKATANLSYNDRSYVSPDMGLVRPTYWMLNSTLEYRPKWDDSFAVRFWGKNLTNSISYVFAAESATGWYSSDAPPRTYGISFEKDF